MGTRDLFYSELSLNQLRSRPTIFIPRWATHPSILSQAFATRGAVRCRHNVWGEVVPNNVAEPLRYAATRLDLYIFLYITAKTISFFKQNVSLY